MREGRPVTGQQACDRPVADLLERLTEESYYTSTGDHVQLLESLQRGISDALLLRLADTVFCLVKPDAVAAGKARAVCEYFAERGFAVAHARPLVATHPRQFELLYAYNLTLNNELNQVSDWWLNVQLLKAGPMHSTLLVPTVPLDRSAHATIARLKGSSTPQRCTAGELRHDLGATNKSLNLVHVADDPLSTAREFLIFHDREVLAAALREVDVTKVTVASGLEAVDRGLQVIDGGVHDLDFVRVMARLQLRAHEAMGAGGHGNAATWGGAWEEPLRVLIASRRPFEERFAQLLAIGQAQMEAPSDRLPCEQDGGANRLARLLAAPQFSDEWAREVEAALDASKVYASPWESLVLRSTAHYSADLRQAP
jgi:nucleoside diphosphate kinase